MRLLERNGASEFILTKDFVDDEVPPYAILSHTWGADAEEVTFEDLTNGTGQDKAGYEKLQFCRDQVKYDGLRYFWVDTCCINKANFTELSHAINSMFRWYQKSAKCYVYLLDVSTTKRKASDQSFETTWEPAFRESKWFRRGWTLQELLAPRSVEFFSRDRKRLGDKRTLESQIHDITKIAVSALRGTSPSQFSVEERFSWSENRQTTHKEDKAYSLLGIFEVHMPLIYGEGEENALKRLRREIGLEIDLVDHLPFASEAPFNSYTKQHEPTCLPDTRTDLLQTVYNWADGKDERCIFWLNGLAGTGKSTIARTVCRKHFNEQRLGASFFFSRGGGDVGHAGKFCTTVAVQLAGHIPTLRQHIYDAITEHGNIAKLSLYDQWRELVLKPLSKLSGESCLPLYIVVIDALDECGNDNDVRIMIHLLSEARSLSAVRLRILLTSRPEIPVRHGFYQIPDAEHQVFVLHKISPSIVDHDIYIFLKFNFELLRQERSLDAGWPGEEIITSLVRIASGLFIWAATTCRFIHEGKQFAAKRLNAILQSSSSVPTAPEKHLDEIYTTVLKQSIPEEFTKEEREQASYMLRRILSCIVTLSSPLSASSLGNLLGVTKGDINQTLDDLHSILDIPEDGTRPLRLHHPSFRGFLLDQRRCADSHFWVDEKQAHQALAEACVRLMSASLKQDICGLDAPGVLVVEVKGSRVEECLPPEVQYACLYWVEHIQEGSVEIHNNGEIDRFLHLHNNDEIHRFLETHFLHWLEALSWMRRTSEGILASSTLKSIAYTCHCLQLYAFIRDMERFALSSQQAVEQAPLQVYCSALIFAPAKSIVRKQFKDRIPGWMQKLPVVLENWGASPHTLESHTNDVVSLAFSPNGKLLVSTSLDWTVKLWDAATGTAVKTFVGRMGRISSVAFSPDNKLLALASRMTILLWDATTGAALMTLKPKGYCQLLVFSPDSKLLACDIEGGQLELWDAAAGVVLKTLKGHTTYVKFIAFSPDGKLLASASGDSTVRLWNAATGAALKTLEGHNFVVSFVAFSPDARLLASASWDRMVRLWDPATGRAVRTLKGHTDSVKSVAISPDGKLLASASQDGTVKLWDAAKGATVKTIKVDSIYNLSFSSDGWFLETDRGLLSLEGYNSPRVSPRPVFRPQVLLCGDWVIRDSKKILWLPFEYRAVCSAFKGSVLAFAHRSGRVTFMEFN